MGLPIPILFAILILVLLLLGGLLVLTGGKVKLGAVLLIIYLVPTIIFFYLKWDTYGQQMALLYNLALLGGVMALHAAGGGKYVVKVGL